VWAFGCVLFEALTGRSAFTATTFSGALAAAGAASSVVQLLPASVPPRVASLIGRCLQPDPTRRQRDVGDARLEIEDALAELAKGPAALPVPHRRSWLWWPVLAALAALAAFALGQRWPVGLGRSPVVEQAARDPYPAGWSGQLLLGGMTRAYQPQVSPDGKWLAFIVLHEGQAQVGVMKLGSGEWWVLTRNRQRGSVNTVCWSRDSNRLFFDRVFDVPVGVFSASPHDRAPEGAREAPLLKEAECPQAVADGSLVVGKLDSGGKYRIHRRFPDGAFRPVGPLLEFNRAWPPPIRALHSSRSVVFCGKVLDDKAPPRPLFYLLDLDTGEHRPLFDPGVVGAVVPLAIAPSADFAYTVRPVGDVFHIVRIPLAEEGRPEPLLTLTSLVWGLDVDADGRLFLDQVQRPLDVLKFDQPGESPGPPENKAPPVERVAGSLLWCEPAGSPGQPVELPDGRVLVPSKVAGRDRLLASFPGKDPTPLLEGSEQETALPAVLVSQRRLAFVAGSGKDRRLRLATLEDDGVRLEPVDLQTPDEGLSALAASPDGKALYFVQSRQVYEVPTDGSRPPSALAPGNGVAVYPATGELLIQRFDKSGVRLFRRPRHGVHLEEIIVQPGPWRLAPVALSGRVIGQDGRVLVTAVSGRSWFWRPALLDSKGKLHPIPAAYDGDIHPAGWSKDGRVLGTGYALSGELWRITPAAPRQE
jgi:hypothetical protein